jgi:hypothetical protein
MRIPYRELRYPFVRSHQLQFRLFEADLQPSSMLPIVVPISRLLTGASGSTAQATRSTQPGSSFEGLLTLRLTG